MLKIGLLGVGHLGKIHLRCIREIPDYELVGFYDPDKELSEKVAAEYNLKSFGSEVALMEAAEVVDVVTPTIYHHQLAKRAMELGKHLFIEKPLTHTLAEAKELLELSQKTDLKIQVGHVERFNPAMLTLENMTLHPMFIEGHRLAAFNARGTDVSVILDLMIHDLDIVLSLVSSKINFISASGVAVVSNTPDIANARIEFENGCVANLTASRISMKQMRKLRLFQKDAYISLDFLDKQAQIVRLYNKDAQNIPSDVPMMELETNAGTKLIHIEMPKTEPVNAIKMELESLANSIQNNTPTSVGIEAGYRALEVAYQIIEQIEKRKGEVVF